MEKKIWLDNQNDSKYTLKSGLRADIWMHILDFICDISLFTEIPRISKLFYRLSQSYPNFKTSIFLSAEFAVFKDYSKSLKPKFKSIFVHSKALNLLLKSHNLNSVTFNISHPKNKTPRSKIELKELNPSIKRVNLIAEQFIYDRFSTKFMREAIELSIKCPNISFGNIEMAVGECQNLKIIKCESKYFTTFFRIRNSCFKNFTEIDLSIKIGDCPCFDWCVKMIIQNIIQDKVLKFFKCYGEFLRFTNELISMMNEVSTLKTIKFKGFSLIEPEVNLITNFLNAAAHSKLVSISITTPIKSHSKKNTEYKLFINAVDYLLKNCQTLKHFRLTSFNRLSNNNIKHLASIIIESIKSDRLETFNKLDIKSLAHDKVKTFYIKYDIQLDNKKLDLLLFLILLDFIPKSDFLEKIVLYKHQITEINIKNTMTSILNQNSLKFIKSNLYNHILFIISLKVIDLTSLNINCKAEIYNEQAIKLVLSSSNLNHLKLSLQGNKNSKSIFFIIKSNPLIFSKMKTLKINLKNEILTPSTFSRIIISETLTSITLKNFTICASEKLKNLNLSCLQKLEMIKASFSQDSFDFIVSLIKSSENLEIIRLEKCCVCYKKTTSLETMQKNNIKNSEAIVDSLILKTNLKKVFIQINKNLDKERKSGYENIGGIKKIVENNHLEELNLVLPFSEDGLIEFNKLSR
ncbi:hypothetical protein SteCoe_35963 [Stentor coeruleus]|uniref:Uncharacterized protein n=1 Tax=Stentor coeruleus TaxID=5963 RepID=A0A1R2ARE3_9CILI|nr:hypothetical protein SteCoe_35963 [Stentor coeruleus]